MTYYRLRMSWTEEGKEGFLDTKRLRDFIQITNIIGIGRSGFIRDTELFVERVKKGDLILVLDHNSMPLVLTEAVKDAPEDDFLKSFYDVPASVFSLISKPAQWIRKARLIKILAWYEDDKNVLRTYSVSPDSWGRRVFSEIDDIGQFLLMDRWYHLLRNKKRIINSPPPETALRLHNAIRNTPQAPKKTNGSQNGNTEGGLHRDTVNKKNTAKTPAVSQIDEMANLLRNAKNLILTGAPGTGKTFLAKKIACAITGDPEENPLHVGFCQFHPSYDYTDFIEGLRPIHSKNGNIGFERRDGAFMAFCRECLLSDHNEKQNGPQAKSDQDCFKESWNKLLDYLKTKKDMQVNTLKNKSFILGLNKGKNGLAKYIYKTKEEERTHSPREMRPFFSYEQLYNVYRGLPGVPNRGHDNYRKAIIKMMKSDFGLKDYIEKAQADIQNKSQKYVFIIDEINRGDIAKIFGELFFAVDPDYRGPKGAIRTQYANLNQNDKIFRDGKFYVPENVYIIGTMNDIDRNVESMDLAIRRRFAWAEILPEDTVGMLLDRERGIPTYAEAAKKVMTAINEVIKKDDLGPEYQLGAAYFLKLRDYNGDFKQLWNNNIMPLFKEYYRGRIDAKERIKRLYDTWSNSIPRTKK